MRSWIADYLAIAALLAACEPSAAPVPPAAPAAVISLPTAHDSPAAVVDHPDPPTVEARPLNVRVRQDGRSVVVHDHDARVARRAFELVVTFPSEPREILLNASFKPFWYDQVRRGIPLEKLEVFAPGRGMAEGVPPDRELIVSEEGSHFLYWSSDSDHRCHAIERNGAGLDCVRRVDRIIPVPGATALAMDRLTQPVLYLSFMKLDPGPSVDQPIEVARDWLRLRFEDN